MRFTFITILDFMYLTFTFIMVTSLVFSASLLQLSMLLSSSNIRLLIATVDPPILSFKAIGNIAASFLCKEHTGSSNLMS